MLSAVKLDDEASIGTTKVNDVAINWRLTLEFEAIQSAIPQSKPQHALGVGLVATKSSGGAHVSIHCRSPLTPTLSPPGRGGSPSSRRGSTSWLGRKPSRWQTA